jgi:hypothetical protein
MFHGDSGMSPAQRTLQQGTIVTNACPPVDRVTYAIDLAAQLEAQNNRASTVASRLESALVRWYGPVPAVDAAKLAGAKSDGMQNQISANVERLISIMARLEHIADEIERIV